MILLPLRVSSGDILIFENSNLGGTATYNVRMFPPHVAIQVSLPLSSRDLNGITLDLSWK